MLMFPSEKEAYQRNTPQAMAKVYSQPCAPMRHSPRSVETLRWRGATPAFAAWADRMKASGLLERCEKAAGR